MARYRKKPIVVEAILWRGGDYSEVERFCGRNWGRADANDVAWLATDDHEQVVVWNTTGQQYLQVPVGHWIIRGPKGDLYPCAGDVFAETYEQEPVADLPQGRVPAPKPEVTP